MKSVNGVELGSSTFGVVAKVEIQSEFVIQLIMLFGTCTMVFAVELYEKQACRGWSENNVAWSPYTLWK